MALWAHVDELDRQTDQMAMEIFGCTLEEWRVRCADDPIVVVEPQQDEHFTGEQVGIVNALRQQGEKQDDMSVEMGQIPLYRSLADIDYTESMMVEVPLALPADMQDLHGLHDVSSMLFCHTSSFGHCHQQQQHGGLSSLLVNEWFDTL